jgi:hypothetical protein
METTVSKKRKREGIAHREMRPRLFYATSTEEVSNLRQVDGREPTQLQDELSGPERGKDQGRPVEVRQGIQKSIQTV